MDQTKKNQIRTQKKQVLAIHRDPKIRNQIKEQILYPDKEKTQPLAYTNHAKLLGVTFSEQGTFHKHIQSVLNKCHGRTKMLSRFAGVVPGPTLYKAYRVAIEPIALYGTEVIYENLSTITLKKFNHLEFTAIKTSYKLPRTTPVSELIPYLELEGIANRIETRRNNFVKKKNPPLSVTEKLSPSRKVGE